jgi:hypothetical protein
MFCAQRSSGWSCPLVKEPQCRPLREVRMLSCALSYVLQRFVTFTQGKVCNKEVPRCQSSRKESTCNYVIGYIYGELSWHGHVLHTTQRARRPSPLPSPNIPKLSTTVAILFSLYSTTTPHHAGNVHPVRLELAPRLRKPSSPTPRLQPAFPLSHSHPTRHRA